MPDSYQGMSPLLSYTVVKTPSSEELQRTPDSQYSLLPWQDIECKKQTHTDVSQHTTKLECLSVEAKCGGPRTPPRRKEIADAVYNESQLTMKGEAKEENMFVPQRHLPGRDGLGREGGLDEVGVPGVDPCQRCRLTSATDTNLCRTQMLSRNVCIPVMSYIPRRNLRDSSNLLLLRRNRQSYLVPRRPGYCLCIGD